MNLIQATIITIGDELLIGQVIDTNSAYIAQSLNKIGVTVNNRIAVGDDKNAILDALTVTSKQSNIIILTGGLGPTADDITKPLLNEYFGGKLIVHQPTLDHITDIFVNKYKRPLIDRNIKQAEVPDVCDVLTRQRGAGHIANVICKTHACWTFFTDELFTPRRLTNFGPMRFTVRQNFNTGGHALGVKTSGVIDQIVFADDAIKNHPPHGFVGGHSAPAFGIEMAWHTGIAEFGQCGELGVVPRQRHVFKNVGLRAQHFLRLLDFHEHGSTHRFGQHRGDADGQDAHALQGMATVERSVDGVHARFQ